MRPRPRQATLWVLTIVLAGFFLLSGFGKLTDPAQQDNFVRWGYPVAFTFVVGAAELLAAALLVHPRSAWMGAGTLAILMAGATFTHLRTPGEAPFAAVPLVLLGLALLVAWARRPAWLPRHRASPSGRAAP